MNITISITNDLDRWKNPKRGIHIVGMSAKPVTEEEFLAELVSNGFNIQTHKGPAGTKLSFEQYVGNSHGGSKHELFLVYSAPQPVCT